MTGDGSGVVAGRYRLAELVGTGGMGSVWRADDVVLARPVALKEIAFVDRPTAELAREAQRRALREARIAARMCGHPAVVGIHDVIEDADRIWLILEYVPSRTLAELIDRDGPLTVGEAARIGAAVAGALAAGHAIGVVHRDVKPGNVLVGAGGLVKLADFGVSHLTGEPTITQDGAVIGTPAYASPEWAARGTTSPASDVYSLGSTLYAAVEGDPPFGRGPYLTVVAAVSSGSYRPAARAGRLGPLLDEMLRVDAAARPDAAEVHRALTRLAAPAVQAGPATVGAPPRPAPTAGVRAAPPADSIVRAVTADPTPAPHGAPRRTRAGGTAPRYRLGAVGVVLGSAALAVVLVLALIPRPAAPVPPPGPTTPAAPVGRVIGSVTVGDAPTDIEAFGDRLAVVTRGSGAVSVIDASARRVVATIPVPAGPTGIAVTADGGRAWVTSNGVQAVSVLDLGENRVVRTLPLPVDPTDVVLSPDGGRALVTGRGTDELIVIDTGTMSVIDRRPVGRTPSEVAVSPDGSRAYVTNFDDDSVSVVGLDGTLGEAVPVHDAPFGVTLSRDGRYAFVTNAYPDTMSVIDTASRTLTAVLPKGDTGVTVAPDGRYVYAARQVAGSVTIVDAGTLDVVGGVRIGAEVNDVAVAPDGRTVYATATDTDRVVVIGAP